MTEHEIGTGEELGRRKFLAGLIGVIAGAIAAVIALPALGYVVSPGLKRSSEEEWYTLGPIAMLTPNVPMGFPYSRTVSDGWVESSQSGVAYAVTPDNVNAVVFADTCTHLSCRVTWQAEKAGYFCPCHDGLFGAYGEVLAGPPPRPLDQFETRIENGQIQILLE
jgi:menaquinol-cytochrome c reductase iron-sulfur subunit